MVFFQSVRDFPIEVCKKTEMKVAVRFPIKESLKAIFIYGTRETHPALGEKFVMGIALANKVLVKLVTSQTFSEQKSSESFWLIDPSGAEYLYKDNNNSSVTHHTKGADSCLSGSLKLNRVVRCGVRRQVKYMGRHKEIDDYGVVNGQISSPSFMDGIEKSHLELVAFEDEEKNGDDDIGEEKQNDDAVDDDDEEYEKGGDIDVNSERYKMAEENLLSVMIAEKPILGPQLREEAKKKIGNIRLLNHLLDHMAEKIAQGSDKRFRRRHNPDGAMDYWLENADLVNIRRDAGVTDPYWVPQPGWKPGDSPTQDPICARVLKVLKDGLRDLMAKQMLLEDEVGKLKREMNEIAASRRGK